jgi:hypothetical protein
MKCEFFGNRLLIVDIRKCGWILLGSLIFKGLLLTINLQVIFGLKIKCSSMHNRTMVNIQPPRPNLRGANHCYRVRWLVGRSSGSWFLGDN